jgi:hypothetical protein
MRVPTHWGMLVGFGQHSPQTDMNAVTSVGLVTSAASARKIASCVTAFNLPRVFEGISETSDAG